MVRGGWKTDPRNHDEQEFARLQFDIDRRQEWDEDDADYFEQINEGRIMNDAPDLPRARV